MDVVSLDSLNSVYVFGKSYLISQILTGYGIHDKIPSSKSVFDATYDCFFPLLMQRCPYKFPE